MDTSTITALLTRWKAGDAAAEAPLLAQVYPHLLQLAQAQVRRNAGVLTLQSTELAHELYMRLHEQQAVDWQNRDHFLAVAAILVRRVVVDYLRQRGAEKRGGSSPFITLDQLQEGEVPRIEEDVDWLGLDRALTELAAADAASARVVEMKFFAGMTTEQIAQVCGSSVATVGRQWRFARAWLARRLGIDPPPGLA